MSEIKLKPCPICGRTDVYIIKQLGQEVEQVTERLTETYPCDLCNVEVCYRQCYKMTLWAEKAKEKLAEYETVEEEGRLVALPCKNWMDIVFGEQELFYGIDMDYTENPIREITVHNEERFTWYDGWKTVVLKGVDENGLDWEFAPEEISKTVFLTREEAEKALEEMRI